MRQPIFELLNYRYKHRKISASNNYRCGRSRNFARGPFFSNRYYLRYYFRIPWEGSFRSPCREARTTGLRRRAMHQRLPFPKGGCHPPLVPAAPPSLPPPSRAATDSTLVGTTPVRRVGAVDAALPWKPDAPSATPSHGAFNRGVAIRARKCNGTSITGIILAKDTFRFSPDSRRIFYSDTPSPRARERINLPLPPSLYPVVCDLSYVHDRW